MGRVARRARARARRQRCEAGVGRAELDAVAEPREGQPRSAEG